MNIILKIGFVSLGCAKNRVDTEIMMGLLKKSGHKIVDKMHSADLVVINTCGFLTEAKEEAIDNILSIGQLKKTRQIKYMIATGCLAQRHGDELMDEIPELDAVIGTNTFLTIPEIVAKIDSGQRVSAVSSSPSSFIEEGPRVLTTPAGSAYLKISEGCNNCCTYCAIPSIRGNLRTRPIAKVVEEVQNLLQQDIKELVVIGQDPASYGKDLNQPDYLVNLIDQLDKLTGDFWLRIMYLHPAHISAAIIDALAGSQHVIPYLDIPIQHSAGSMLSRMNRHHDDAHLHTLIKQLKDSLPGLVLRTTVMVGFPGETDKEFQELCRFIQEHEFDWLGAFAYSPESGTPAAVMPDQVPEELKQERWQQIMALQNKITRRKNVARVGKVEKILISSRKAGNLYVGRGYFQAPEVDGITLVKTSTNLKNGQFVPVSLVGVRNYDMIGELNYELTQ